MNSIIPSGNNLQVSVGVQETEMSLAAAQGTGVKLPVGQVTAVTQAIEFSEYLAAHPPVAMEPKDESESLEDNLLMPTQDIVALETMPEIGPIDEFQASRQAVASQQIDKGPLPELADTKLPRNARSTSIENQTLAIGPTLQQVPSASLIASADDDSVVHHSESESSTLAATGDGIPIIQISEAAHSTSEHTSPSFQFATPEFTDSTPTIPTASAPTQSVDATTKIVTDNLIQQVKFNDHGESKQLVLQLHPAELGQVTLQVDWENESLKVKLTANEMAATEILNQNRAELVSALAEEGIDFDSLDISYDRGNEFEQQPDQTGSGLRHVSPQLFPDTDSQMNEVESTEKQTGSIDITI